MGAKLKRLRLRLATEEILSCVIQVSLRQKKKQPGGLSRTGNEGIQVRPSRKNIQNYLAFEIPRRVTSHESLQDYTIDTKIGNSI